MTTDISRKTFNPKNNYSGVIWEQGRVRLDAEDNEAEEIQDRRWRAETLDVVGRCGVPAETSNGFLISTIDTDPRDLTISPGRMYVDGLLAENHGTGTKIFNPTLAEDQGESGVLFNEQPYRVADPGLPGPAGRYLVYLDVWQRDVTFLQDPDLEEQAVGVDTTGRTQTVWQVKILDEALEDGISCQTPIADLTDETKSSEIRLSTSQTQADASDNPCLLPPRGGYRGLTNRTYRVEIHEDDENNGTFFKWSRNNGIVATSVEKMPSLDKLEVKSLGKDSDLSFKGGDWVEILDDRIEFEGTSGIIRKIEKVDPDTLEIFLEENLPSNKFPAKNFDKRHNTRVRRWDKPEKKPEADGILPLPAPGTTIELEDGVQVQFHYQPGDVIHAGDFWIFHTRTEGPFVEELDHEPPRGIHHHYCKLALVEWNGNGFVGDPEDCREVFDPLTDISSGTGCCTIVVEPGENIQDAIDSLPDEGGCVCLKTGSHEITEPIIISNSNISLHGESPGTRVVGRNEFTLLALISLDNFEISNLSISNIDFFLDNSKPMHSFASSLVVLDNCVEVMIEKCRISCARPLLLGVSVRRCENFRLEYCEINNVGTGLQVVSDSTKLSLLNNSFTIAGSGNDDPGLIGIFLMDAYGSSHIEGNTISGFRVGIALNRNAFDGSPSSQANRSVIDGNTITRLSRNLNEGDQKLYAIDVAAWDCVIKNNKILYFTSAFGGINITGPGCRVENNYVEYGSSEQGNQKAIGILIGYIPPDLSEGRNVDGGRIERNTIKGPQMAITGFRCNDIDICSNNIEGNEKTQVFSGVFLIEASRMRINKNRIRHTDLGLAFTQGSGNRLCGNEVIDGTIGVTAFNQTSLDIMHNRIEIMKFGGFLGLEMIDKIALTENRFISCGYDSPLFALGVGIAKVEGELSIMSCEISDTGFYQNKINNKQPAFGMMLGSILQCRIQSNLVTYTEPTLVNPQLEHRALWLRGLRDFQPVRVGGVLTTMAMASVNFAALPPSTLDPGDFGYSAQVLDNKFIGPGREALIEFQQEPTTSPNILERFERVFFNNNYCLHYNAKLNSAWGTLKLVGRSVIVMGNHMKSITPFHSVNLQGVSPGKSVFLGNITDGGTFPRLDFPNPETDFNR